MEFKNVSTLILYLIHVKFIHVEPLILRTVTSVQRYKPCVILAQLWFLVKKAVVV